MKRTKIKTQRQQQQLIFVLRGTSFGYISCSWVFDIALTVCCLEIGAALLILLVFSRTEEVFALDDSKMAWRCSSRTNEGLVENLARAGIVNSRRVMEAMTKIDRAKYVGPSEHVDATVAYMDSPQPIGHMQTISAPHMVSVSHAGNSFSCKCKLTSCICTS